MTDRTTCSPFPPIEELHGEPRSETVTEISTRMEAAFDPVAALQAAGVPLPEEIEIDAPIVEPEDVIPAEQWQQVVEEAQELREAEPAGPIQREGTSEFTNDDASLVGTGAIKYDGGKPAVWQGVINYFPRALMGVAEISTFGANKYSWNGWEKVENGYARYRDAQFRHALKDAMGEENDPDSNLLHLKHEAWGALAALELALREREGVRD